jgi:UDP-N-acetylglucosamine 2-epimerase (non-hydrolysing)
MKDRLMSSSNDNGAVIDIIAGARPNPEDRADHPRHRGRGSRRQPPALAARAHRPALRRAHVGRLLRSQYPQARRQPEVGSHAAEQTAAIMVRYEQLLRQQRSNLCLVVGDVT